MKLPMYITANCDGRVNLNDVGFFDKEFSSFVTYLSDLMFGDDLAGTESGNSPVSIVNTGGIICLE